MKIWVLEHCMTETELKKNKCAYQGGRLEAGRKMGYWWKEVGIALGIGVK